VFKILEYNEGELIGKSYRCRNNQKRNREFI